MSIHSGLYLDVHLCYMQSAFWDALGIFLLLLMKERDDGRFDSSDNNMG